MLSMKGQHHVGYFFNLVLLVQGDEDDGGSPADVAKSYMRARPPWASPSIQHGELKSTSPQGMQLFNEESKYSIGRNSVSTSKVTFEIFSYVSFLSFRDCDL